MLKIPFSSKYFLLRLNDTFLNLGILENQKSDDVRKAVGTTCRN